MDIKIKPQTRFSNDDQEDRATIVPAALQACQATILLFVQTKQEKRDLKNMTSELSSWKGSACERLSILIHIQLVQRIQTLNHMSKHSMLAIQVINIITKN
jgi:hypothetical protein